MERWKLIEEYPNYEVSSEGKIRNRLTGRILKEVIKTKRSRYGYRYVFLFKNSNRKMKLVHRLVAKAFIPNPNNYPQINHKDENSLNNRVENLEWCTQKYNMNYGTLPKRRKEIIHHSGWKATPEARQKMRLAKLGVPSKRKKKVIINGTHYESITDAMHQLGLCTRAIYRMLKKGE